MTPSKTSKRIVSAFLAGVFLWTEIFVQVPSAFAGASMVFLPPETKMAIQIPADFGKINEIIPGAENRPLLIHIQNAHRHYEAEKNVQSILTYLNREQGVENLLLEGGWSKLNPSIFRTLSEKPELNRKMIDELVKAGELTGAESFLIEQDKAQGWGIENLKAYVENGKAFESIMTRQKLLDDFIGHLKAEWYRLASKLLSKDLNDFIREEIKFYQQETPLQTWLDFLGSRAEKYLQLNLRDIAAQAEWPLLVRYFKLAEGKEADEKLLAEEKASFLKELRTTSKISKTLTPRIERVLAEDNSWSSGKKTGPSVRETFEELYAFVPELNFKKFPNLRLFIQQKVLLEEFDGEIFQTEVDRLTHLVIDALITQEKESSLIVLLRQIRLLERLFSLELTRADYDRHFSGAKREISPEKMLYAISVLKGDFAEPEETGVKIQELYHRALAFYRLAVIREKMMMENAFRKIQDLNSKKTVLISGGFHTDYIREASREAGLTYISITPRMSEISDKSRNTYLQAALGEAVVGSAHWEAPLRSGLADAPAGQPWLDRFGTSLLASVNRIAQQTLPPAEANAVAGRVASLRAELRSDVTAMSHTFLKNRLLAMLREGLVQAQADKTAGQEGAAEAVHELDRAIAELESMHWDSEIPTDTAWWQSFLRGIPSKYTHTIRSELRQEAQPETNPSWIFQLTDSFRKFFLRQWTMFKIKAHLEKKGVAPYIITERLTELTEQALETIAQTGGYKLEVRISSLRWPLSVGNGSAFWTEPQATIQVLPVNRSELHIVMILASEQVTLLTAGLSLTALSAWMLYRHFFGDISKARRALRQKWLEEHRQEAELDLERTPVEVLKQVAHFLRSGIPFRIGVVESSYRRRRGRWIASVVPQEISASEPDVKRSELRAEKAAKPQTPASFTLLTSLAKAAFAAHVSTGRFEAALRGLKEPAIRKALAEKAASLAADGRLTQKDLATAIRPVLAQKKLNGKDYTAEELTEIGKGLLSIAELEAAKGPFFKQLIASLDVTDSKTLSGFLVPLLKRYTEARHQHPALKTIHGIATEAFKRGLPTENARAILEVLTHQNLMQHFLASIKAMKNGDMLNTEKVLADYLAGKKNGQDLSAAKKQFYQLGLTALWEVMGQNNSEKNQATLAGLIRGVTDARAKNHNLALYAQKLAESYRQNRIKQRKNGGVQTKQSEPAASLKDDKDETGVLAEPDNDPIELPPEVLAALEQGEESLAPVQAADESGADIPLALKEEDEEPADALAELAKQQQQPPAAKSPATAPKKRSELRNGPGSKAFEQQLNLAKAVSGRLGIDPRGSVGSQLASRLPDSINAVAGIIRNQVLKSGGSAALAISLLQTAQSTGFSVSDALIQDLQKLEPNTRTYEQDKQKALGTAVTALEGFLGVSRSELRSELPNRPIVRVTFRRYSQSLSYKKTIQARASLINELISSKSIVDFTADEIHLISRLAGIPLSETNPREEALRIIRGAYVSELSARSVQDYVVDLDATLIQDKIINVVLQKAAEVNYEGEVLLSPDLISRQVGSEVTPGQLEQAIEALDLLSLNFTLLPTGTEGGNTFAISPAVRSELRAETAGLDFLQPYEQRIIADYAVRVRSNAQAVLKFTAQVMDGILPLALSGLTAAKTFVTFLLSLLPSAAKINETITVGFESARRALGVPETELGHALVITPAVAFEMGLLPALREVYSGSPIVVIAQDTAAIQAVRDFNRTLTKDRQVQVVQDIQTIRQNLAQIAARTNVPGMTATALRGVDDSLALAEALKDQIPDSVLITSKMAEGFLARTSDAIRALVTKFQASLRITRSA